MSMSAAESSGFTYSDLTLSTSASMSVTSHHDYIKTSPIENNNPDLSKVCPWTLFLTMSLTLLKGLMPHVPQMLPFLITDPEMRSRAEETFMSPEFQENIEEYFVANIKVGITSEI